MADFQVFQKSFIYAKTGNLFRKEKLEKVALEDEEFNDLFNVRAVESLDVFYVLTPQNIEKIKDISKKTDGTLIFCFVNNELHIGINNNQDYFEHSAFEKIDYKQVFFSVNNQLNTVMSFVDLLNLDNNLFRRGV